MRDSTERLLGHSRVMSNDRNPSVRASFHNASNQKPLLRRLAVRNGFGDDLHGMEAEMLRRRKNGWPNELPHPTYEVSNAYV